MITYRKFITILGNIILQEKLCHFSGVLSSEIFDDISKYGAYAVSIHPVYAFADKYSSYINLGSAHLVMEAY